MTAGWQCPVCGGGVAPTVERCPCVTPRLLADTPACDVPDSIREFVRDVGHGGSPDSGPAGSSYWKFDGDGRDIVAYKVLP